MRKQKRNRVLPLLGLAVAAIGTMILLLTNTVLRRWLIIGFSIRVFNRVSLISKVMILIGLAIPTISSIPLILAYISQRLKQSQQTTQQREQDEIVSAYAKDSDDPKLARRRLEIFQGNFPDFGDYAMLCLEYLNRLDDLRARQKLLIMSNDASYIDDTMAIFNGVEHRICNNIQSILNLCIVAETPEDLEAEKIRQLTDDIENRLSDTTRLLKLSADWVNQRNKQKNQTIGDALKAQIEVMNKILESGGI